MTKSEDKKIVLIIKDPITALHKDGRSLNIRDIFEKKLKYRIAFNKAGSTGKVSVSTLTSQRYRLHAVCFLFKCPLTLQFSRCFVCLQKNITVDESRAEISGLDEDQSYCFSVVAYIPSRKGDKRFGEWSRPKCSSQEHKTVFEGKF